MNNQTTQIQSTLLRNKLSKLAIRLQKYANPLGTGKSDIKDFNTLESVISESIKTLSEFYKKLSDPGYKPVKVIPDTLPKAEDFNNNFLFIKDDITTIFEEFENLEGITLGNYNYMVSKLNRLNGRLKSVSSSLGDLILFANFASKDAVFFSDSFNNLDRIELNSPLINTEQAEINQVEGIVTLPINIQAQSIINISEIPIINSSSNGNLGNNEELNAKFNGNISDILDNNADTWFEYEKVNIKDDNIPLILDITINIGDPKIINFIRINPNNFGTRTQIKILSIDTSIDGKEFVSIKDDIPIADFITKDEENVFSLAPSTSKFAGQGLYTFTPRKAKYVHLTFKQETPYIIINNEGKSKFRYAIGIRDIDIQAIPYKQTGEIISSEISLNDEIRKIVIQSNQNPDSSTISTLAYINHYISPDNGITWHQIRPKESTGESNTIQTVPELLDFNGVSKNSIITSIPITSIRYKALLNRNTDAFISDSAQFVQEVDYSTELHTPPLTTPFNISLQKQPIKGTLNLIDPLFGSRGKSDVLYNIAIGTGNKLKIKLPFKPLKRDFVKDLSGTYPELINQDSQNIYVDGELWERGSLTTSGNYYKLNHELGELTFGEGIGDKITTFSTAVPQNSIISMNFNEERLFPGKGTDHIAKLDYPISNDKKQAEIYLVSPPENYTKVLKKGSRYHNLKPDILYNPSNNISYSTGNYVLNIVEPSSSETFLLEQSFIDGSTELTASGQYSFDFENGILHTYSPTSSIGNSSISFFYNPRDKLLENEWDFFDSEFGTTSSISILDSSFKTFKADTLTVPSGVTYFNLEFPAIVQGTVKFLDEDDNIPDCLSVETDYIDGRIELLGVIKTKEQLAPITGTGNISIPFKMKISSDIGFSVDFTNKTIFKTKKSTELEVTNGEVGDYYIDRSYSVDENPPSYPTGRIYVKTDSTFTDPGIITYYYINPQANLTGKYSINYKTGEIFTYDPINENGITANYEYTDYRIRYNIARLVPSEDWEFDESSKKITISDREILKNQRIPQSIGQTGASQNKFYQASYKYVKSTRENIDELEPYFSPVLKDYALKIITKSRLI